METAIATTSKLTIAKNASYVVAFITAAEYLQLTPSSIAVLAILIVMDVITGVIKSGVIRGWNSIRSSIMERGILAKALVILTPLTIAIAGKGLQMDLHAVAQAVISVLILSEAYSIIGNIYAVRTGKLVTEFDAVAYVLEQIREFLKKIITEDPLGPKK